MALGDHLRLALLVNGNIQIKTSSISISFDSGNQRVDTLEGLAGKTPGSGSVSISGTVAVPVGGPETDFMSMCARGEYVTMQVPWGAKSYSGLGWIQTANGGQSTNANTELSFEWVGAQRPLE